VDWKTPAAFLHLKKSAFWALVHNEDVPHYRLNARVFRFRMSAVIKWVEGRQRGGHFIR
jgi:predicted DNA-binding transcriptional regulator AlpA